MSAWVQLGVAAGYVVWFQPHHPASWPGWQCWGEVWEAEAVMDYLKLGGPGILAMTEWWFWEFLCFTAGTLTPSI